MKDVDVFNEIMNRHQTAAQQATGDFTQAFSDPDRYKALYRELAAEDFVIFDERNNEITLTPRGERVATAYATPAGGVQ